jgi:hypothetical protein
LWLVLLFFCKTDTDAMGAFAVAAFFWAIGHLCPTQTCTCGYFNFRTLRSIGTRRRIVLCPSRAVLCFAVTCGG